MMNRHRSMIRSFSQTDFGVKASSLDELLHLFLHLLAPIACALFSTWSILAATLARYFLFFPPIPELVLEKLEEMPKYKIKYLNLRARAESIRLLLNYVQHPFEDSRENFLEYAKYKDKYPLPHLPKLLVDNQFELCYTSVILIYLGEKFGLESDTPEEKAVCAMLAQRINEHFDQLKPYVNCLLGLVPAEKLPSLGEQCLWPCITEDFGPVFERQLEMNNTGYLVGDKLTWIDFYAASFADLALTYGRADILDKFPRVLHHCRAVYSLPQLQQHIKNRPDTLF